MITILNPHIADFVAEPILFRLLKRRPLKKYSYLITESVKKYGKIDILVNSASSGLVPLNVYIKLPYIIRTKIARIEIQKWKKINNFGKEVVVHFSPKTISDKTNLVFFNYKNYQNPKPLAVSCSHFTNCVVHLSHYHNSTTAQSNALAPVSNIYLAADVDISDNFYFRKFFAWYKKEIFILPFAIEDRFTNVKPWADRSDKILSVGTFHYCKEDYLAGKSPELKDFYETSHADALHPLRRVIFEKKDEYKDQIDCMNSPYIESGAGKSLKKILAPGKLFAGQQKYFSFDITKKFNDHKFVIVGEELVTGLPGIGTYEALACGCIVIGDTSCYGNEEIVNLVQVKDLTIDTALDITKTATPGSHIPILKAQNNFNMAEAQLNRLTH